MGLFSKKPKKDDEEEAIVKPALAGASARAADQLSNINAALGMIEDEGKSDVPDKPSPPTGQQKEKEDRLRDRSLYKQLLDALYDSVLIVDPEGNVIAANVRAVKHFGYEMEDFWNMPIADLVGGITNAVLLKVRSHLETGRFTVVNATCKHKDGSSFHAEIAIACINLLNDGDLVFSVRNIEKRHKAHAQRTEAIEAVQQAASAIVVADGWGRIKFVNPAFLRMWKYTRAEDVLEKHIAEFWHSQKEAENLMKLPRQSASWSGPLVAVTSDSRQLKVFATASPSKNRRDEITKIVFTFSRM